MCDASNRPCRSGRRGGWDRGERAGRVSPLTAATLLLLVTMVVSGSPAAPKAAFVHPVEQGPAPARSVVTEQGHRWLARRREAHAGREAARMDGLDRVLLDQRWSGHTPASPVHPVRLGPVATVRAALINLPPPAALV